MPDQRRLLVERRHCRREVVGDGTDLLVGEHLGVFERLLDGLGIVGPVERHRRIPGLVEDGPPVGPAVGEEPEAVDEHDRLLPGRIRRVDLGLHSLTGG